MSDIPTLQKAKNSSSWSFGTPEQAVLDEREHFYICSTCGQAVDTRRLDQMLHHAGPDHEPLGADS
jgi:hypothetical protein